MYTSFWAQKVPSLVRWTVYSHPWVPRLHQEWWTGTRRAPRDRKAAGKTGSPSTPQHACSPPVGRTAPAWASLRKEKQSLTLNLDEDGGLPLLSSPSCFRWKYALSSQWRFLTGQLGSRSPGQSLPLICRGLSALGCWLRHHRLQVSRSRLGQPDGQVCQAWGQLCPPSPALSPQSTPWLPLSFWSCYEHHAAHCRPGPSWAAHTRCLLTCSPHSPLRVESGRQTLQWKEVTRDLHHLKTETSYIYPWRGGFYVLRMSFQLLYIWMVVFKNLIFKTVYLFVQSKFLLNDSEQSEKHITKSWK